MHCYETCYCAVVCHTVSSFWGSAPCPQTPPSFRIRLSLKAKVEPTVRLRNNFGVDSHYITVNPLNAELNPICYLLALLGAHHFLHVSRIRVKVLTFFFLI